MGLKFRFQDLFETYGAHLNGPVRVNPIPASQWAEMIITKIFWATYRIILPLTLTNVFNYESLAIRLDKEKYVICHITFFSLDFQRVVNTFQQVMNCLPAGRELSSIGS